MIQTISAESLRLLEEAAKESGNQSIDDYVKMISQPARPQTPPSQPLVTESVEKKKPYFATSMGRIYHADAAAMMNNQMVEESVDLIVTSPPFGLVRKKPYGNEDADRYLEWFRPFAQGFHRVLKNSGSLVVDVGGTWIKGQPTRSLYHFKLLIMLVEEFGFHLCQEHYWWNPSKLPTPAEWVNIRRVRVKDAVNCIWWLSKTPYPKANNRRVLSPYSDSMKNLFRDGYTAKARPSGHDISEKFSVDNGGAVPPNLLGIANTTSRGRYQEYCKENDLPAHPARFPALLPEYFTRMLTDPSDLVLDPFGGSCITGNVAENLGRNWVCIEKQESYIKGAISRFSPDLEPLPNNRSQSYSLPLPCSLPANCDSTPLGTGDQKLKDDRNQVL